MFKDKLQNLPVPSLAWVGVSTDFKIEPNIYLQIHLRSVYMVTIVVRKLRELGSNEQGLGMLEMILIIAVIVILAGIFRTQLKDIINSLLGKAKTKSESFMNDK